MRPQNHNPAFESHYRCDECLHVIVNPLCPFCLTTEITAWLSLYPDLKKALMPSLHHYLIEVSSRITSYGTTCIKCKESRAFVCPRCFTERVVQELDRMQVPPLVREEFHEFFNFDTELPLNKTTEVIL